MLQLVDLAPISPDRYEDVVGVEVITELREQAKPLQGARVAHINATSNGGGESRNSRVPSFPYVGRWVSTLAGV
jgi:hypothetical protein